MTNTQVSTYEDVQDLLQTVPEEVILSLELEAMQARLAYLRGIKDE